MPIPTLSPNRHEQNVSSSPLRVAVTFDDGYRDNLEVAAPILLKYKIPFTVFVTSSFVHSNSSVYLTPAALRELADLPGVRIGSHGISHVPLGECVESTLWEEVAGSRRILEALPALSRLRRWRPRFY